MGRRDAVAVVLEVNAECRRLLPSLAITYTAGWETRGNGSSANYAYGNLHHTATPTSAARPFPTEGLLVGGRSDLPGPLTNYATPWCTVDRPRLHVIAAHPANHAGASRASGPVPALALYNPQTLGNEIDYAGSSPMSDGQRLVAAVWTRAVANVLARGNVEHVRAHAETSITGKWDPGYAPGRTIDMSALRRDAATLTPLGAFLMALTDGEQRELLDTLRVVADQLCGPGWRTKDWGWPTQRFGGPAAQEKLTAVGLLWRIDREVNSKLDAATLPRPTTNTLWGHAMSAFVLAGQAVEQAKVAATRQITVDPSKIDLSRVALAAPALSDADAERIAGRVAELLAQRLAQ